MSKVRCSITSSLDGFVAGPNQGADNPSAKVESIFNWAFSTKTFLAMHGDSAGGETGINDNILREGLQNVAASIMGRNMFGPVRGPWGQDPWKGWWGDNPPFHHPVFVLTHHAHPPLAMQGGTTFHFTTGGIESALAQARQAAPCNNISRRDCSMK